LGRRNGYKKKVGENPVIPKFIKRIFCKHDMFDQHISQKTLGVCLGMTFLPEVEYEWTKTCKKCGRVKKTRGYLMRSLDKTPRDKADWPLNPDGTKMEISK
jgi:hypothetical protein